MKRFGDKKFPDAKGLLNAIDVAILFNVTEDTIRRWTHDGKIPCIRFSRTVIRYNLSDLGFTKEDYEQAQKRSGNKFFQKLFS